MNADFYKSLDFVLKWEGNYTNDPLDKGGETKFGISKRAFPDLDIKNLTVEQAQDIYYRLYWLKANCNILEYPLCMVVMDTAVNMGVNRAMILLNQSNGNSPLEQALDYLRLRRDRYNTIVTNNPTQAKFLKGWLNRVNSLQKTITS